MSRIGPKTAEVVDYVSTHPGCVKIEAARHVSPHPEAGPHRCGLMYGYRTVDRAISAGLVIAYPGMRCWRLELTERGRELVRSWK